MRLLASFVFALSLLAAASAHAQVGPDGKGSYVNFRAGALRKVQSIDPVIGSGVSVDWGGFQSEYVATGTRLGFERADAIDGFNTAFYIQGGPQFHIPLGDKLLLIPTVNFGGRLSDTGYDLVAHISLGFATKLNSTLYLGGEIETPIYAVILFPGTVYANGFVGFYY